MTIRAVVFDFDGVIANTEPLHFRAYRDVLAARGVTLGAHDYYARYLGYDDVGAFRAMGADNGHPFDARTIEALVEKKARRVEALERDGSVLFAGAADAVRRLAAAFPMAIASGALRAEIERVLAATGLARYFVGIVAAEDTACSKPAPDPYRRAVDLLRQTAPELQPSECLAIEDSRWGLESARAAGLRTLAVAHTYDSQTLSGVSDAVVESLATVDPTFVIQTFGSRPSYPSASE